MYDWEAIAYGFAETSWRCQSIKIVDKPIRSLVIKRDQNLSLSMIAHIRHNELIKKRRYKLGEIYSDFETVQIYNEFKANGSVVVTHIANNNLTYDEDGSPINKVIIGVKELEVNYSDLPVFHTIEWITNLRAENNWYWPDSVNIRLRGNYKKEFSSKSDSISIEREDVIDYESSASCLKFYFEDEVIFVGEAQVDVINDKYSPGFILYQGCPSNEKMEKIRLALSYTFGRYLPSLGYSKFDEQWGIVSYKCIQPYDIEKRVYTSATEPPQKIYQSNYRFVEADLVSKSVESFCLRFDEYDLRHISSLYWHAANSPLHVQASQLGAAIEAIRRNYMKVNEKSFKTKLFDSERWADIQKELIQIVEMNLPDDLDGKEPREKKIIKNKIKNLNQTPHSEMAKRFFEVLALPLSDLEEEAFQERHNSAHGVKGEYGGIAAIKNNQILKALLNRVLIKILNMYPFYIDYYTAEYPQKNINQSIGG